MCISIIGSSCFVSPKKKRGRWTFVLTFSGVQSSFSVMAKMADFSFELLKLPLGMFEETNG